MWPGTIHRQLLLYGFIAAGVLVVGLVLRAEVPFRWDSFGYVYLATQQQSSSFYLGRWWFVAAMSLAWWLTGRFVDLPPLHAHVPMQGVCLFFSCLAAVGLAAWTYRLTKRRLAALAAGIMVVLGPVFWIHAAAVMTEPMALAATTWAFYAWQRAVTQDPRQDEGWRRRAAWAGFGGFLFGIGVDIREPLILLLLWPLVSCWRAGSRTCRRLLGVAAVGALASLAIGVTGGWTWSWRSGLGYFSSLAGWAHWMSLANEQYSIRLTTNAAAIADHLVSVVPAAAIVLVLAALGWVLRAAVRFRRNGSGPRAERPFIAPEALVALTSAPYAASLLINPDLPFNSRYGLPLGWMLAPFAGSLFASWVSEKVDATKPWSVLGRGSVLGRVFVLGPVVATLGLVVVTCAVARPIIEEHEQHCAGVVRFRDSILALPPNTLVLPGNGTPVAQYLVRMGVRRDLDIVQAGWNFPYEDVDEIVDAAVSNGRPVYVHPYRHAWSRRGAVSRQWRSLFLAFEPYLCDRASPRTSPFVPVRGRQMGDRRRIVEEEIARSRTLDCIVAEPPDDQG